MNAAERQAYRAKHFTVYGEGVGPDLCYGCGETAPCDFIKVLDFAEWVVNELKDISAAYEGEL